jgi:hypothetical protein
MSIPDNQTNNYEINQNDKDENQTVSFLKI